MMARRAPHSEFPGTVSPASLKRRILREGARSHELRDDAFRRMILSIPRGKVSTYGKVAAAAGYPLYHRAVARLLRTDPPEVLPWYRVVGAGGQIKVRAEGAREQMLRLKAEGVTFRGSLVDMPAHEQELRVWEV